MDRIREFLNLAKPNEIAVLVDLKSRHERSEFVSSRTLHALSAEHKCVWGDLIALLQGYDFLEEIEENGPAGRIVFEPFKMTGYEISSSPYGPWYRITHQIVEFSRIHEMPAVETKPDTARQRTKKMHDRIRQLCQEHELEGQWAKLRDICIADPDVDALLGGKKLTDDNVSKICEPIRKARRPRRTPNY